MARRCDDRALLGVLFLMGAHQRHAVKSHLAVSPAGRNSPHADSRRGKYFLCVGVVERTI